MANEKTDLPVYISYALFNRFINGLRESSVPSRVDRSVLSKMSGAEQSSLLAGLRFLKLISDDGSPSEKLNRLVETEGESYNEALKDILSESYKFLLESELDLEKATGQQVADKFRELQISGSTVTKSMAFFISAAKDAGIKLSSHIKPPTVTKSSTTRRTRRKKTTNTDGVSSNSLNGVGDVEPSFEGKIVIPVPLHGMEDGVILFPEGMSKKQWDYALKIATFLLENYRPDFEDETAQEENQREG